MPVYRSVSTSLAIVFLLVTAMPVAAQDSQSAGQNLIDAASETINNIDTAELQDLLDSESDLVLIDVRTSTELANLGGTIDADSRGLHINRGWLEFRIEDFVPDRQTPIVVYCGINQRSPLAAQQLMEIGYANVYNYADGFFAWRDAGLPVTLPDEAPGSILFSLPVKVDDNVYSAIGATAPPTFENSGHNNNLSFIVTNEGVVVVNAGDNYLLAQALHREIKLITDQPVKFVILENGQGHAMLGMNYWQEQGAKVIAHRDAIAEIEEKGEEILERMQRRNRDKSMGTKLSLPDISFDDKKTLKLGSESIEILHLGPTHSPGDIVVWLPEKKLVIAGDMAFHERLLPIFEDTDTAGWLDTWQLFADLDANTVIPGHGGPTDMQQVTLYTHDYLVFLRKTIGDLLESGGSLIDAYKIDQSRYRHLDTFNELAVLNADRVYRAMEFE